MDRTKYIEIGKYTIAYREAGDSHNQTVVFVHGIGASSRYMMPLMQELSDRYRVAALDFPGFGESRDSGILDDMRQYRELLQEFIDRVTGVPVVLVGNSFGCQIIVDAMVQRPDQVSAAVLLGPTIDVRARTYPNQLWRYIVDLWREPKHYRTMKLILEDYARAKIRAVINAFRIAVNNAIEDSIRRASQPVLIIRGNRDPIAPERWSRELAANAPHASARSVAGAHIINTANPKEVAGVMRDFLDNPHANI